MCTGSAVSGGPEPDNHRESGQNTGQRSPGVIIEARYHTANGELRLDLDGKLYAEALGPNDDPLMVARRLLRQKYGRHDKFYGRINYPPHSFIKSHTNSIHRRRQRGQSDR
jgi:hypothetical protein